MKNHRFSPLKLTLTATTLGLAAMTLSACGDSAGSGDGELTVYATTGYLADAVHNIAPEAEVTTMVGPGGDPHTYQPSTQDIEAMQEADVVVWNGLHLEAQMIDQLESLGDKQLAMGDQLPQEDLLDWPDADEEGEPMYDPHVWNSPNAWSKVVGYTADHMAELDPDNADEYQENAEQYQQEIADADEEVSELMDEVTDPRILVTGHDAFNYFGDTYDLDVHATDFISSEAALSAGELSDLADLIADEEVPVVFQDNQASPQAITSLTEAVESRDWDVEISDAEMYADSLGADEDVDTYLKVFKHNAEAVHEALAGETADQ